MNDRPDSDGRDARARNIAAGARSLPEPLRAKFVETACGGDAALRAVVRSILGWEPEAERGSPRTPESAPPPGEPPPPPAEAPPPPAAPPSSPDDPVDRALDAMFAEPEATPVDSELPDEFRSERPTPSSRPPVAPVAPRGRRAPILALLAIAALIWLAFLAVSLSRQAERAAEERDRAQLEERRAQGETREAREEARRARIEAGTFAGLLATEGADTLWRDRIAMRRFLDRAAARVRRDSTLDPAARARLLEAIAGGYRARGFFDRADSLALEPEPPGEGASPAGSAP